MPVLVLGLVVLASTLLLVLEAWRSSGPMNCVTEPGSSDFGSDEWSWMPVGTTCRWTQEMHGFDRIEEPGWVPTIFVAGMTTIGLALVLASLPRRTPARAAAPIASW